VRLRSDRDAVALVSLVAFGIALAAGACGAGATTGLVFTEGRNPPPDIAQACDLAARRCSRCHPLERPLIAHVTRPTNWVWYVDRMRHQPESGITEDEGRTIVRCLVFHSFGSEGLRSLAEGTP
jgi:hypothetical protein